MANTYTVLRATTSPNGPYFVIAQGITATTYTDITATNGNTYYYEVQAVNSAGLLSPPSMPLSATPSSGTTVPTAPTLTNISATTIAVTLTWSAPVSNGGEAISAYYILRSTSPGKEVALTSVGGSTLSYVDSSITNGTTYYYKVYAANSNGSGPLSTNELSVLVPAIAPTAPSFTSVTVGNGQLVLLWAAPSNTGGASVTYNILRGTASGSTTNVLAIGDSITVVIQSDLQADLTAKGVTTVYIDGQSGTGLDVSVNPTSYDWDTETPALISAHDPQVLIVGFGTNDRPETSGPYTTIVDNFLSTIPSSLYVLWWLPYNDEDGGLATTRSVITAAAATHSNLHVIDPDPIFAPNIAEYGYGNTGSYVDSGGIHPTAAGATVLANFIAAAVPSAGGTLSLLKSGVTALTYTDTGLTNGTTYDYEVQAVNSAGTSPSSRELSGTPVASTSTTPGAPTLVSVVAGNAQASLTWTAPSNTGGSAITSYTIFRGTSAATLSPVHPGVAASATTYIDSGLTNGVTYYYAVAAVNINGTGPNSVTDSVKPAAPGKLVYGEYHAASNFVLTPSIILDYAYNSASTYTQAAAQAYTNAGYRLMLKVGNLTQSQATAIAQELVAGGQANAIIPIMWENNQGVSGWENAWNQHAYTAAEFITLFNNICGWMRAVAGAKFLFAWNPNVNQTGNQAAGRNQLDTFPGTGVDGDIVVTVDGYDNSNGTSSTAATVVGYSAPFETLAAENGAVFAGYCECGDNSSSTTASDDPTYWTDLLNHAQSAGYLWIVNFQATVAQGGSFNSTTGSSSRTIIQNFFESAPPPAPTAPTIASATPGVGQVTLIWNAPSNATASGVKGYSINYATNSAMTGATTVGNFGALPVTPTDYTVSGLSDDTEYWFVVIAWNATTYGPGSTAVPATTTGSSPPPTGIAGFNQPVMAVPNGSVNPDIHGRDSNPVALSGYSSTMGSLPGQMVFQDTFQTLNTNVWASVIGNSVSGAWGYGGSNGTLFTIGTDISGNGFSGKGAIGKAGSVLNTWGPNHGYGFTFPAAGWFLQVCCLWSDMTSGFFPAIWFANVSAPTESPHTYEIDLFEGGTNFGSGSELNEVMHNTFIQWASVSGGNHTQDGTGADYNVGVDLTKNFCVWGLEYRPGTSLRYFFRQLAPGGVQGKFQETFLVTSSGSHGYSPTTVLDLPNPMNDWALMIDPADAVSGSFVQVAEVQVYNLSS